MKYYWIIDFGVNRHGEIFPIILGGRCFASETQALRVMDSLTDLSPKAEIIELPTSNMSMATQKIKGILSVRYHSMKQGIVKASHRLPSQPALTQGGTYAK